MVWELPPLPRVQWAWLPALLADAPFRVRMWKNAGDGAACQTGMNREQWPVAKSNPRLGPEQSRSGVQIRYLCLCRCWPWC